MPSCVYRDPRAHRHHRAPARHPSLLPSFVPDKVANNDRQTSSSKMRWGKRWARARRKKRLKHRREGDGCSLPIFPTSNHALRRPRCSVWWPLRSKPTELSNRRSAEPKSKSHFHPTSSEKCWEREDVSCNLRSGVIARHVARANNATSLPPKV